MEYPHTMTNYDNSVIAQWPKSDDPKELRIVDLIKKNLLSTNWAKGVFKLTGGIQLEHLQRSVENLDDPQYIHDYTQKTLARLAEITNAQISEGQEKLGSLEKRKPFLLLTNHLGVYKLNNWQLDELRESTGLAGPVQPLFYPFPLYFSAMYPVAKALDNNLYIASFEYPGNLGKILRASGAIEVPPKENLEEGQTRTDVLIETTRKLIENHPNATITSFPEGGTTGKRNGKGIYDVEPFHTGSYIIAKKLNLTILPVAQYFNSESGFELRVFEPEKLSSMATSTEINNLANKNYSEILKWLKGKEKKSNQKQKY